MFCHSRRCDSALDKAEVERDFNTDVARVSAPFWRDEMFADPTGPGSGTGFLGLKPLPAREALVE